MRRPSFQFYPGDWRNDEQLRLVSLGARGLWIEMMCIMHQAEPYGHLKVGPKVILPANLARLVGADEGEVEGYLGELRDVGVFSEEEGVLICRRMIRDERIRKARAEGGKKGGNPALMKHKPGPKVNLLDNLRDATEDNLEPTPSSSSSSSSSLKAEGSSEPQAASEPAALAEPVEWFPVVGVCKTDAKRYHIREEHGEPWSAVTVKQAAEWAAAFPDLDITAELRKARSWCVSNRPKRKTPRGLGRFIQGWLDRAQNGGSRSRGAPTRANPGGRLGRLHPDQIDEAERIGL